MRPSHHVPVFDHTVQVSREWLHEIEKDAPDLTDQQAYAVLRATLQALRDRLSVNEGAQLAAQLPLLLRGTFYEGWDPQPPSNEHSVSEFVESVARKMGPAVAPDRLEFLLSAVPAAAKVIASHLTQGELDDILANLPVQIRSLFILETSRGGLDS